VAGQPTWVMPVLYSQTEKYDTRRGGDFFVYLKFQFLAVDRAGTNAADAVTFSDTNPRLLDVGDLSGYFEQIGRNTGYIIHPDEILAENFQKLVTGDKNVPSPEVIEKMKKIFRHDDSPQGMERESGRVGK